MKKIVFSFDDGLIDFYSIVFPILKSFNIKATLNVATGLVDRSFDDGFQYCTIDQIIEMNNYGIEMAVHSNCHSTNTTLDDLSISLNKLSEWLGKDKKIFGLVIPFNSPPNDDIFNWMIENKIVYLRGGDVYNPNLFYKLLFRLRLLTRKQFHVNSNSRIYHRRTLIFVPSFPIWLDKEVDYYKKIIMMSPKNGIVTLMFHSICVTTDDCMKAAYPSGAWTVEKFTELIKWILECGFEIVTQQESIRSRHDK